MGNTLLGHANIWHIQPNTDLFDLRGSTSQIHSRPTTQDAVKIQSNTYVIGLPPHTVDTYFPSREGGGGVAAQVVAAADAAGALALGAL